MHLYFLIPFFNEINKFIDLCFETYNGWGKDAKLATKTNQRKRCLGNKWDKDWDNLFVDSNNIPDERSIKRQYLKIMNVLSENIGLNNK